MPFLVSNSSNSLVTISLLSRSLFLFLQFLEAAMNLALIPYSFSGCLNLVSVSWNCSGFLTNFRLWKPIRKQCNNATRELRPHSHRTRKQICMQNCVQTLCVNTPIYCSVFHNLPTHVARCSASSVACMNRPSASLRPRCHPKTENHKPGKALAWKCLHVNTKTWRQKRVFFVAIFTFPAMAAHHDLNANYNREKSWPQIKHWTTIECTPHCEGFLRRGVTSHKTDNVILIERQIWLVRRSKGRIHDVESTQSGSNAAYTGKSLRTQCRVFNPRLPPKKHSAACVTSELQAGNSD